MSAEPPAELFVELPVLRRRAGHDEQPRADVPRVPGRRRTRTRFAGRRAAGFGRCSAPTSSTSSESVTAARRSVFAGADNVDVDGVVGEPGRIPSEHEQRPWVDRTPASNSTNSAARCRTTYSFENTLNWQKGAHTLNFGGSYTNFEVWLDNQQLLPELRFGVVQGDPADGMFTTTNFPGASNAVLTAAQELLRDHDRPRERGPWHRSTRRGDGAVRVPRSRHAARAAARSRAVVPRIRGA